MASGDELPKSVTQGSAEAIEYPCSLCLSRDNTEVEAEKTCIDCDYNMCAACTDVHTKFPSMASHRVVDVSKTTSGRSKQGMLPKERCHEHHGRILDKFCKQHDQLACDSCAGIYHKSCSVLEYIPTFAIGTKKSNDFQAVQKATKALLEDLIDVKSLQKDALMQTDDEEAHAKQMIQDLIKRLHKHVDELANAETAKVDARYKCKKDSIQKTIKTVDDHIEAVEASDRRLGGSQGDNESELFIYIKQAQKCGRDGKALLQQISQTSKTHIPKYTIYGNAERSLTGIKSLGRFYQTVTVEGKREYIARAKAEHSVCNIKGICLLPDASVIITDWGNNSLKRLDTSYTVIAHLDFDFKPYSVCRTNKNNEVAVTFTVDQKVRIFSVKHRMEKTRSFNVGDICRDICNSQGELFVGCGSTRNSSYGNVRVFDMTGSALRTIQTDTAGQPLFTVVHRIVISSDGTRIYVVDRNKGMLTLDMTGKLLASYGEPDLEMPTGICLLDDGGILVAGRDSHNVHHVTGDGRRLGVVLEKQHGLDKPMELSYDSQHSKLLVSTLESDTIKVFDLHVE